MLGCSCDIRGFWPSDGGNDGSEVIALDCPLHVVTWRQSARYVVQPVCGLPPSVKNNEEYPLQFLFFVLDKLLSFPFMFWPTCQPVSMLAVVENPSLLANTSAN